MAILVLVLWLFTAGAGFSVLISSNLKRVRSVHPAPAEPSLTVPAASGASGSAAQQGEAKRAYRERFDPPSLVAARNAPVVPGARALLEFSHPACGIIGLAFWLGFALVHARVLGWIGCGLAAATACAGLTWFALNVRAARRYAHSGPQHESLQHESLQHEPLQHEPLQHEPLLDGRPEDEPVPSFRGRLVALHGAGAALTLVLAVLTAVVLHG